MFRWKRLTSFAVDGVVEEVRGGLKTLHFVHDNQSAKTWRQTRPFRLGRGRWDACGGLSGVNELHSDSGGATPANGKRRSCRSTLFKSCVSTETEAAHTAAAAAAAAVWLCRRNFKNRSRV